MAHSNYERQGDAHVPETTAFFIRQRPRLLGIAYRMLGSFADSEDIVQDVWVQLSRHGPIENCEAWLVSVTTRRSIDRLRAARVAREFYFGMQWSDPDFAAEPASPEDLHDSWDDLSLAVLTVLECLTPEARSAFLMHDVFDTSYAEVASMIDKSEAACRQLLHRTRERLRTRHVRYRVPAKMQHDLVTRFAEAISSADLNAMRALLHESAVMFGNRGGIAMPCPG